MLFKNLVRISKRTQRSARLRLAGHIVRMTESDTVRKSTSDLLQGERMVGRPKRRWIVEVEREMK
jgi:hypothetical protein